MSKILAVRLSSLGDVVLTQPVITALAQTGHEVSLLTKPAYRAVAEMFPGIAGVLTSPEDLTGEYALVLDWHGTLRARTWISRLKKIKSARYAKRSWARRLLVRPWGHPVFWNTWPTWGEDVSVTAAYARAAEQAGLTLPRHEPRLVIPASAQQAAAALLTQAGVSDQEAWVAMAPGAKWPTKQWSWEAYGALAADLEKNLNLRTVFLGGSADIGVCQAARVRAGGRAVSLAGQTSLPALAALLSQARLLVSNDSGPLHLG
ncbi:MAG: glycosyltransferase family 9 protein, partial [Candidatus Firestonebacteria bacterium]|nr:glycosyltransferase family 9 protein [Candidatus Firestonebacteria bacterium]